MFRIDAPGHPVCVYHFSSSGTSVIRHVAHNAYDQYEVFKAGKYSDLLTIPRDILYSISKGILICHKVK